MTLRFIIATVVRCESANEISLDSNKKKKKKSTHTSRKFEVVSPL